MKNVISQVYMIFFCVSRMLQQKYTRSIQALKIVTSAFQYVFTRFSQYYAFCKVNIQWLYKWELFQICYVVKSIFEFVKKRHLLCAKRYEMYSQTPSENFRTLLQSNNWQSIHGHKTRYCCTQRFARYFLYRNKILINNYIIFDR